MVALCTVYVLPPKVDTSNEEIQFFSLRSPTDGARRHWIFAFTCLCPLFKTTLTDGDFLAAKT